MDKVKDFLKQYLVGFVIGIIVSGGISVIAATYFPSNQTTYDNTNSGLSSTNVQGAIDELYNVCFPPTPPATDTITDLLPSNPDELYKDEHGDIRYYGANPNNYISFNNELWRIIGVIDGKIKIIKDEALTPVTTDNGVTIGTSSGFYWNKVQQSGKNYNNWEGATLQTYLNGTYYNSIDGTYKNMISEETYYLGGATSSNYQTLTASGYYNAERDSAQVYSGNPTSTTQHIGLMYPSDYGYAAGESCLSTALISYNSSCKNSDYLFSGVNEWLQASNASDSGCAAFLSSTGYVYGYQNGVNFYSTAVRPVLYLNTDVQITDGDGSQSNPFKLA